ncbi:MAG: tannase/feruloyl esterase family alpha/beta hydrolase [Bryobacterales bacterium]|nr:tannase/feruloyl esterase family alpha/beta hydrolase [Bryobacterales bacterium]
MRMVLAFCLWLAVGSAQTGVLTPPAGGALLAPRQACAALRALTTYEFTVEWAGEIAADGQTPSHCRVRGQILPEIRFEVNLPAQWNHRFLMTGNGGYAGEPLDAPQRAGGRSASLRRGFAVAAHNTGHDAAWEPLGSFAVNRQKLLDYAFRSLHVTAETAKRIIAAYYGQKPARSYFNGCSTGGRQALMLAQRFPEDFDGIVAGAPVLHFSGTMMGYACMAQAFAEAPIPYAKLATLADRVYAQCDEKDGLKDGLIDDPRRCGFTPSRDLPRCAEGADSNACFTAGQIRTLEKIYGDVTSNGKRIFPGWPVGAEIAGPNGRSGWDRWIVNEDNAKTISVAFGESFFAYLAYPEKNPNYKLTGFDFGKDPARLEWIHNVLDATDADLSGFRGRGGKLLMHFGWADPALNAQMGVDYYERVLAKMGADTQSFFRFFLVPGMFHCGGGVGTGNFDLLPHVIEWVEQGKAPDSIRAARIVEGKSVRTRPLCPYPQRAKYKGSGSIDDAANFFCAAP